MSKINGKVLIDHVQIYNPRIFCKIISIVQIILELLSHSDWDLLNFLRGETDSQTRTMLKLKIPYQRPRDTQDVR